MNLRTSAPFCQNAVALGFRICQQLLNMKSGRIIQELCLAYAMELETVQNCIAASVNLDDVRSEVIGFLKEYEKP